MKYGNGQYDFCMKYENMDFGNAWNFCGIIFFIMCFEGEVVIHHHKKNPMVKLIERKKITYLLNCLG